MHLIFSLLLPLSHLWVCYSFCLKYFSSPSHCHPGYLLTVQDCLGGWSHNPWVLSCLGTLCRNSTVLMFPQLEWGQGFRAVSVWLTITTYVRCAVRKCLLSECCNSDLALWGSHAWPKIGFLSSGRSAWWLVGVIYQTGRGGNRTHSRGPLLSVDEMWVEVLAKICRWNAFPFLGTLGPPCSAHALPQHGHLPYLCLSLAIKGVSWPGRVSWEIKLQGPFCSPSPKTLVRPPLQTALLGDSKADMLGQRWQGKGLCI